jgi:ribose 5-phosphate isomerase B
MKKIVIGGDHRGYNLKENIKKTLTKNYEITDIGTNSTEPVDYPDIAEAIAKKNTGG